MGRENKFRGMPIKSNKFVYGQYFSGKCTKRFYGDEIYHFIIEDNSFSFSNDPVSRTFNGIEVISGTVSRFVGLKDKHEREIYEGEKFKFKYKIELHKNIELIGSFCWNDDELRYEIDIEDSDEYTCLSYIVNGMMFDFELLEN